MAIKLLSKSELEQAKNTDRAKEISEGLKISRRVDSLRETVLKEEEVLEKFRIESLQLISKETQELQDKKEKLESQIHTLEIKLSALYPGMETTRKELFLLQQSLETQQIEIQRRIEETNLREIDVAVALKDVNDSLARQLTHEEEARNIQKKASEERADASSTLVRAGAIEANALRKKEETEQTLSLREAEVSKLEVVVKSQIEENTRIAEELKKERIQLADQRATLERALERLRINRLNG